MPNPNAVALGKLGGVRTSERKKVASRANGSLGGRPKKVYKVQNGEADIGISQKGKLSMSGVQTM